MSARAREILTTKTAPPVDLEPLFNLHAANARLRATVLGGQGLGHGGVPRGLVLAEGVGEDEELAHAGGERQLGWLAGRAQPAAEGVEAETALNRR